METTKVYLVAELDTSGPLPVVVDVRCSSETAWMLTRHGRKYDYAQLGVLNIPEGDDPKPHAQSLASLAHPWALPFLAREVKLPYQPT